MKKLIVAAALALTATSAAMAQGVYVGPGYGGDYYDYAPGYGNFATAPAYGYGYYGYAPWTSNDSERGGPGPRVGAGSGMGVGSQR